jgi:hypothetical protein
MTEHSLQCAVWMEDQNTAYIAASLSPQFSSLNVFGLLNRLLYLIYKKNTCETVAIICRLKRCFSVFSVVYCRNRFLGLQNG